MNQAWAIQWRSVAVAIGVIAVIAVARTGGEAATCAPPLERAQTSLRDLPATAGFLTTNAELASAVDPAKGSRASDFAKSPAACATQTVSRKQRDTQRALAATITATTTRVIDRNAARAVVVADARP